MDIIENLMYNETSLWIAIRIILTLLATGVSLKIFRATWRKIGRVNMHQMFIKNVLSIIIWLVGGAIALNWLPHFADAATALIAGSGLLVLVIGLAAQETLGNLFSGLFISIFKPFEVGDRITLSGQNIAGFIEDITLRHTVVRTITNNRIIVPNSTMNRELIENANYCNLRVANGIDVTITYESDLDLACEIMANVIGEHKDFVDTRTPEEMEEPKVSVLVRALGLNGVELRAFMWTETTLLNVTACSDARRRILQEFQEANITIASARVRDVNLKEN
jgi:small-conductance mechanosensitive channel